MSTFIPGQRVRVVANHAYGHYIILGSEVTVESFDGEILEVFGPTNRNPDGVGQSVHVSDVVVVTVGVEALKGLIYGWHSVADAMDSGERDENTVDLDGEANELVASAYRDCAEQLAALLDPNVDTESSASRQHYIETGRYLKRDEAEHCGHDACHQRKACTYS